MEKITDFNDKGFLEKVRSLGSLDYPLSKCVNVLDLDSKSSILFEKEFDNHESDVYKSYNKGKDQSEFLIDKKLFEMAQKGDLKALEKFEQRKDIYIHQEKLRKDRKSKL